MRDGESAHGEKAPPFGGGRTGAAGGNPAGAIHYRCEKPAIPHSISVTAGHCRTVMEGCRVSTAPGCRIRIT